MYWYLFPFAIIYGIVISIRNKLYDFNILKTKRFNKPVICVGNLAVGGTGKTPHTEYLIKKLKQTYSIAVLSRGYKRVSKGYVDVQTQSKVNFVGDEPLQMKQKFPDIQVAVDESRVHGIETIHAKKNPADIVILDDAFQHRKVTAGFRILLTDFNKPLTKDFLMPVGRLREQAHNRKRAHCMIVTKCPSDLKPMDFRLMIKELDLYPFQKLYFTTFSYQNLLPLKGTTAKLDDINQLKNKHAIVVTGIANPKPLYDKLSSVGAKIHKIRFGDHHHFAPKDLVKISQKYLSLLSEKPVVICTEKDAVKFNELTKTQTLKNIPFYYLPIKVKFLNNGEDEFLSQLKASINDHCW